MMVNVLQEMIQIANAKLGQQLTSRLAEPIIALQYADDTVILASTRGNTLHVLHEFSAESGLAINNH
jgi:hypothetical protein